MNSLPLENILVLDFTRMLPGPFASQMLGDLGARVIRFEAPIDITRFTPPFIEGENKDELWSGLFLAVNRNKESVALNLKKENHKQILRELIKKADVLLEGFRPGIMNKLGFGYDTVKTINSKIIYCSLSGFGQNGKMKSFAAHDINYFGLAGWLSNIPLFDNIKKYPPINMPLVPVADFSGAMFAVIGILTALVARTDTKMGCYVDTSLFESIFAWISGYPGALKLFNTKEKGDIEKGEEESYLNNVLSGRYPYYTIYQTSDNKWLSLGALEPVFWEEFCKTLGLPELIKKQYQLSSPEELEETYNYIQEKISLKSLTEWMEIFKEVNTCLQPIRTLTEIKHDTHLDERGMILKIPHPAGGSYYAPNIPIKFSEWKINSDPKKPPENGEHTLNILKEFGIDERLYEDIS